MGFFDLNPEEQQEVRNLYKWAKLHKNPKLSSALEELSRAQEELYLEWGPYLEDKPSFRELPKVSGDMQAHFDILAPYFHEIEAALSVWRALDKGLGNKFEALNEFEALIDRYDEAICGCVAVDNSTLYAHPLVRKRIEIGQILCRYERERSFVKELQKAVGLVLLRKGTEESWLLKSLLKLLIKHEGISLEKAYDELCMMGFVSDDELKSPEALDKWVKRWFDEDDFKDPGDLRKKGISLPFPHYPFDLKKRG